MKPKLQIFTRFIDGLLPHEWQFAKSQTDIRDVDHLAIWNAIQLRQHSGKAAFNPDIDKRKYSQVKQRINEVLEAHDVDLELRELHAYSLKVALDQVTPEDEKALIRRMRQSDSRSYHFIAFFDLMLQFRMYLQVRLRKRLYPMVHDWISTHQGAYEQSRLAMETLHEATVAITEEYQQEASTVNWEEVLKDLFFNLNLDRQNRYAAAVRLWFLYMNCGGYQQMEILLDAVEKDLLIPHYLSKRILVNYYANRLLLHSKLDQLDKAAYYGFLSLKVHTSDHLFYVTNLSAVLLRMKRTQEAVSLMRAAMPEMQKTSNLHNKMGFIAQYVHCLIDLGQPAKAEQFAENYLKTSTKEVLNNRWHLFFAAYFRSLVLQEKFSRLLFQVARHKIREREVVYSKKPYYLPTMSWYITLATFMEGQIPEEQAVDMMAAVAGALMDDPVRVNRIQEQLKTLSPLQPIMIAALKSRLKN